MKKVTGMFFAASVLCFWLMASLVIAAPPGAQPQTSQAQQALKFPDIKVSDPAIYPPSPKIGDIALLKAMYWVTGCVSQPFFGKIEVDGQIIGGEQELGSCCNNCDNPNCHNVCNNYFEVQWQTVPGNHTIVFTIDSKNDIVEGSVNEYNNTKSFTINVPVSQIDKIKDMKTKQPIPVPVPRGR